MSEEDNGFMDFLGAVGDKAVELGSAYGQAAIEREMREDTETRSETVPGVATVQQGQPAPVTAAPPAWYAAEMKFGGLPVNKAVLYGAAGLLGLALVLKIAR